LTESKTKPKKRLVAVVGIDADGKRYEPGDPVGTIPNKTREQLLRRGKIKES